MTEDKRLNQKNEIKVDEGFKDNDSRNKMSYQGLLNKTLQVYGESGSLAAYNFITKKADQVRGNLAQIYNFRYCLACDAGREKEALSLLKEAVLEKGFWYSYDYLTTDEDLQALHKYDDFKKVIKLCKQREETARNTTSPEVNLVGCDQTETDSSKLVIALHGNQENIEIAEQDWQAVTKDGFCLALPQSSQVDFSEGYLWDDLGKGAEELKGHYQYFSQQKNINPEKIIIGGFSAGARVALYALLNEMVEAQGFIFVAPWLPEIEEWKNLIGKLKDRGLRGYIICGDQDQDSWSGTRRFVELLEENQVSYIFKAVEKLDHQYPDNFDQLLHQAISYLTDQQD